MERPRLIRYLENGVYKYASVKDIGDLNQLMTEDKTDIVSAINYLVQHGGASGISPETQGELDKIYGQFDDLSQRNKDIDVQIIDFQTAINQVAQQATSLETSQSELQRNLEESLKAIQDQKDAQDQIAEDLQKKLDFTQYTEEYTQISDSLKEKASQLALDATKEELGVVKNSVVYKLEILSSNGLVFKSGQINTELEARVYHGSEDKTDEFNASRFIWQRISNDLMGDVEWNRSHSGGTKKIIITPEDVKVRATFNCKLLDEQ